jgi:hypothetical protein
MIKTDVHQHLWSETLLGLLAARTRPPLLRRAGREWVTINACSPPLWRMGAYEVKPTGELQRHSISYAEELRPLAAGSVG